MKKTLVVVCAVLLGATSLKAQKHTRIGLFVGYGSDIKEPAIGANAEFGILEKLSVSPSFAYYFTENTDFAKMSFWELNANAHYYFTSEGPLAFYGLAGLNYTHASVSFDFGDIGLGGMGSASGGDGKIGLNVGGGANFNIGSKVMPFAEIKYTAGGSDQLAIFAGIKYNLK